MLELVYRIQIKEPNILVVRLEEKGSRRILYLDHLQTVTQEADKAATSFLIQIHRKAPHVARNLDTASFQQIEVPAALSNEAMRLMAKTGRLFFNNTQVSFHPIGAKVEWRGEKHSERACTVEAFVEKEPLSSIDLIFPGSPYWTLKKGVFQSLATDISWSWLERFLKGPVLLEAALKKKFLEEDVAIIWKEKEAEKLLQVFPQLILQDVTGCFAHLWMEYPEVGRIPFDDANPCIQGKTRLKDAENLWEKDLLETGFIRKVVGSTRYFCPSDQVRSALQFLLELGWTVLDFKGKTVRRQTGEQLFFREEVDQIVVSGNICFQDAIAPLKKMTGRLWVELNDGSVGLIDPKALESISHLLQEAEEKEGAFVLPRQKISLLSPWLTSSEVKWSDRLKETISQLVQGIAPSLPDPRFQGALLPYQQAGLSWLNHLHRFGFSGFLADEMGLGKTVQVLAFFSQLRTKLPILIVAPTSLLINWKCEAARFLPDLVPYIHSGPERTMQKTELEQKALVITSYAILRQDESLLKSINWEVIILDESQAIKNARTQTARSALQLKSRFRLCLSGTPVENRPEEFVSQFQFLLPNLLSFNDSMESLKRKSRPFFLRRKKSDVQIELPEKREQILWLEMTDFQKELYASYQSQIQKGLLRKVEKEGASSHRMEILEAILRLRQICCDPRLLRESFSGSKLELLKEEIEEIVEEKRKVLIYSQFTSFLSLIKEDLASYSPLYLDGSMSFEERGAQVQKFQEDPTSSVFLLSLKAGGSGLNLTAADTVILLDPWWNDAVEQQAIDRAHRMGQTQKILAKRYLTISSIEEKILQLKKTKQTVADQLIGISEEAFNWSAEDLLDLLL